MEAKDIFEAIGLEPAATKEDFLKAFQGKYYTAEQAKENLLKPMVGQKFTKVKQNILAKMKEEGIEFTHNEFEDKILEDVAFEYASRVRKSTDGKIKELELKVGQSGTEVVKEWEEKYNKAAQRAADEERLRKELAGEYEGFKKSALDSQKNIKLDYYKNDVLKKIKEKFSEGKRKDELAMEGYESRVSKLYKPDFDDQGNPFVTNDKGERIRSADKADQFMSYEDVLLLEAKKLNLLPETPAAGKPVPSFTPPVNHPFAPAPVGAPNNPAPVNGGQPKKRTNPMFDNY